MNRHEIILPAILTSLGGILVLIIVAAVVGLISGVLLRRLGRLAPESSLQERCQDSQRFVRKLLTLTVVVCSLGLVGWNGWLFWQGHDSITYNLDLLRQVDSEVWFTLLRSVGTTVVIVLSAVIAGRMVARICTWLQARLQAWGEIKANDAAIGRFFRGLQRALRNTIWLSAIVLSAITLGLPDPLIWLLLRLTVIYLIIAVGLTIIRITAVIVDTLNALSAKVAEGRSWHAYYERLRPLVPLLRRCLEYALWIGVATLVIGQLPALSPLATHGPQLIQAIGIFFLARVTIELAHLIIDQVMLAGDDLADDERKRRQTIVPLIKTIGKQIIYFAAFVLILGSVGFDPMPFLAGAGILGVVLGLGAQPLINDVVSGFFILFENTFLVGDTIRCGDTYGTVMAIDFRSTRVRDPDGNLHILRNGDLRHVINYSKDYTYAVLEVVVAHRTNVEQALSILSDCGSTLAADPRVRGELTVRGITRIDDQGIHLRAVMEVAPGEHFPISAQLRQAAVCALQAAGISLVNEQQVRLHGPTTDSGPAAAPQPAP